MSEGFAYIGCTRGYHISICPLDGDENKRKKTHGATLFSGTAIVIDDCGRRYQFEGSYNACVKWAHETRRELWPEIYNEANYCQKCDYYGCQCKELGKR